MERNNNVSGIYVIAGAYDTGKSSTLRSLKEIFGYQTHSAASDQILSILGNRSFHPKDQPFVLNNQDFHICPRCKPLEFTELVLNRQLEIEKELRGIGNVILERGYGDYLAYLHWMGINNFSNLPFNPADFARYRLVFLLEVMGEWQESKWGFSKEERRVGAIKLNELIFQEYTGAEYKVIIIPPGAAEQRAVIIDRIIRDKEIKPPRFYIISYQEDHKRLLFEVNDLLKKDGLYSSSLLYRITGEKHLAKVLQYGTDRAGLTQRMHWKEQGYLGRPRKFENIIYASTEEEIPNMALKKIPITTNPYLLVYDGSQMELVHRDHQYAFKNSSKKKESLLAIFKIKIDQ